MSSHNPSDNPWQDQASQTGRGHQGQSPYQAYQAQPQSTNPYVQQPLHAPHPQSGVHTDASPWDQEPGHSETHNPFNQQHANQPSRYGQDHPHQSYEQHQQQPPYASGGGQHESPPGLPPRRTATDMALPTGQDRSHQIEVMQSYEASGRRDEDDSNVEILQREFPKIDGSLIAAIYGDSKSLSATREMLQALE
ncbi:hypothetical protein ACN47E_004668 [Coniothyrium glycines]